MAVADFEILSTPAYLAGNQHVLHPRNQTFAGAVPVATAALPAGAVPVATAVASEVEAA